MALLDDFSRAPWEVWDVKGIPQIFGGASVLAIVETSCVFIWLFN